MKVKTIKIFNIKGKRPIPKGTVLKVRLYPNSPFDLLPKTQIIEGGYSGEFIPKEFFIKMPEEETYSAKEWNDMENYYMKLLDTEREKVIKLQTEKNEFLKSFGDIIKLASVSSEVSSMLNNWLNAEYESSEEVDRMNFSLKLTNFIQEKLV